MQRCSAVLIALSILLPATTRAQLPVPSFAIVGGVEHLDHANGSTAVGAIRADLPLLMLVGEGSLGVMHPSETGGSHTYVMPEAQLQYQLFPLLVRPYVGLGGGVIKSISGPNSVSASMVSASVGVRATVPLIGAGLRADARWRGFGSGLGGRATEFTIGVSF